ncbi:class I SAM-dependent methyltransferase [Oscillochloris sp. ZM17-4]|uniref:class I SAM-dependent methyltransferase n=1 Tax=Oscillochloris sp. ZM17-4 TaxID=2866714 RepID=UPI001C734942|nr:class I SAM-dependent methyltransferase [Oscillochloris sp. ZM17-4]MBX0327757.1 class I SAM-dependent methyltransferase [Oscillochloris sp. ZM17-4]
MIQADTQLPAGVAMERVPCEVCGADDPRPAAGRADLFLGGDTIYTHCRCGGCGVIYQHPRPTAATIGRLYPDEDYPEYVPAITAVGWLAQTVRRYGLRKRCRRVTRQVRAGRLLDVGCSTGDFVWEMRRQPGWSAVGIDISPGVVRYAQTQLGVDGAVGVLNRAPFADGSFDAITMWNVFEHVYDPRAVIAEAARLLRPGGALVITHPNLRSVDRRLFGNTWIGYELPRHIYLYPADLLRDLMGECGLREVERSCFYGSHAATATSLTFLIEQAIGRGRLSAALSQLIFSLPARLIAAPYFMLIDRLGMGSNITGVFRK